MAEAKDSTDVTRSSHNELLLILRRADVMTNRVLLERRDVDLKSQERTSLAKKGCTQKSNYPENDSYTTDPSKKRTTDGASIRWGDVIG